MYIIFNRKVYFGVVVIATMLLTACQTTPAPPPEVAEIESELQPQQNTEAIRALSEIIELKVELKLLRNSIEELQFESENTRKRQQDLSQDLDRRLSSLEQNQQALMTAVEEDKTNENNNAVTDDTEAVQVDDSLSAGITDDGTQDLDTNTIETTVQPAESTAVSVEEQQVYDSAFELLKQSRYEDAISMFQSLSTRWPQSELADDAYYWMSEARYVNREFEVALNGFRTVVTQYADSQRVPEALLKIGYIQYDIGAYTEAADTFREILTRFPGHQVTVSAQTRLRRIEQTIQ